MKESTNVLFLRPILLQDFVIGIVVVPVILCVFMNVSERVKAHIMTAAIGAFVAVNAGLLAGSIVKYYLVRPAIDIMDRDKNKPEEVLSAVRSISILPLAEAITIFLRW